MINFEVSDEDARLIDTIVDRAVKLCATLNQPLDRFGLAMDITATHANGCPLKLTELLVADDFNFAHDIFGIINQLDRRTGKLPRWFLPRFAQN